MTNNRGILVLSSIEAAPVDDRTKCRSRIELSTANDSALARSYIVAPARD